MAIPRILLLLLPFIVQSLGQLGCVNFQCNGIATFDRGDCGVDPHDGSFMAQDVEVCICKPQEVVYGVTYTGATDNRVTVTSSSTYFTTTSTIETITFSYNVYNTDILDDSTVTMDVVNGGVTYSDIYYQYSPVTSIHFVEATVTESTYTSTVTTTTSTTTTSSTTAITQSTSMTPCTTGTATVTAESSTTTTTSTITPSVKTKRVPQYTYTTTHEPCLPDPFEVPHKRNLAREVYHADLYKRQSTYNVGSYETQWCIIGGEPAQTTYTTGTTSTTTTITTTDTSTDVTTSTVTSTSTPSPLTTTICSNVEASVTTTPTSTSTVITTAKRSTTTIIESHTFTITIYPRYPTPCCEPSRPTNRPHPPGHLLLPPK